MWLRHHGIPQVFAARRERVDGVASALLVMEYVEGTPLAQTIAERQGLEPAAVMHLFVELLGVLDYLHGRVPPVLHRDVKPTNIIVRPDGTPALVDFGSVRRVFLGPDETGSTVAGTYGYMPYEQYMGQASPASDLYALGATMLHLLTGRPPREFMTDEGRIEVPADLPGDARVRAVIARLLRPSPAERFASARDVSQALVSPTALVPAGGRQPQGIAPIVTKDIALPPAPRAVEGATRVTLDRVAPSMWQLMDASNKQEATGMLDILMFAFFSLLTAGSLPVVFFGMARARRRRLRRFFAEGVQGTAGVLNIQMEPTAFGERMARVSYEFVVDGQRRRDTDQVLPVIANRWQPGDQVQILYLPHGDHDSVIISTT